MRNLTEEEQESLYEGLSEISEPTGVHLFDYINDSKGGSNVDKYTQENTNTIYNTLEAIKLIKKNPLLIMESTVVDIRGKIYLKCYSRAIVKFYDNCNYMQPTLDTDFLNKQWMIVPETEQDEKIAKEFLIVDPIDANTEVDASKLPFKTYNTFEAIDYIKNNPTQIMEWVENKHYGRTHLKFKKDRIVTEYNKTSYTQPEFTNSFLSRIWKVVD